ncbi:hypothetical protein [Maridesulfovibrio sp.]|uniref:hypothetical protein n=1 Tax=Maridesulfovibrio sp. TaxID=2795000 RepID=UPI0029CAA07A|nr:hypothetical protein [Maridesulfovibrio sp.]
MGLEVGWYLRFARTEKITALVDKGTEDQLRHQLEILPEWDLEIFEEEDHVRAVFHCKVPRGKKSD